MSEPFERRLRDHLRHDFADEAPTSLSSRIQERVDRRRMRRRVAAGAVAGVVLCVVALGTALTLIASPPTDRTIRLAPQPSPAVEPSPSPDVSTPTPSVSTPTPSPSAVPSAPASPTRNPTAVPKGPPPPVPDAAVTALVVSTGRAIELRTPEGELAETLVAPPEAGPGESVAGLSLTDVAVQPGSTGEELVVAYVDSSESEGRVVVVSRSDGQVTESGLPGQVDYVAGTSPVGSPRPRWSPDGDFLAYLADGEDGDGGGAALHVLAPRVDGETLYSPPSGLPLELPVDTEPPGGLHVQRWEWLERTDTGGQAALTLRGVIGDRFLAYRVQVDIGDDGATVVDVTETANDLDGQQIVDEAVDVATRDRWVLTEPESGLTALWRVPEEGAAQLMLDAAELAEILAHDPEGPHPAMYADAAAVLLVDPSWSIEGGGTVVRVRTDGTATTLPFTAESVDPLVDAAS